MDDLENPEQIESPNIDSEEPGESDNFYHQENIPDNPNTRDILPPGTVPTQRGVNIENPIFKKLGKNPANDSWQNASVLNKATTPQGANPEAKKPSDAEAAKATIKMATQAGRAISGDVTAMAALAKDFFKDPKAFLNNIKQTKSLVWKLVIIFILIILMPFALILGILLASGDQGYVPPAQYSIGSTVNQIACQNMTTTMETTYHGQKYTLYLPSVDGTGKVAEEDAVNLTPDIKTGTHQYEFPNPKETSGWESLSTASISGQFNEPDYRFYIASRWPNNTVAMTFGGHGGNPIRASGIVLPPEAAYWGKKLIAINPSTGAGIVLVALEYGPAPDTGIDSTQISSQKSLWENQGGAFNPPGFLGRSYGIPGTHFSYASPVTGSKIPNGYTKNDKGPWDIITLNNNQVIQVGFATDQSLPPGGTFTCQKPK